MYRESESPGSNDCSPTASDRPLNQASDESKKDESPGAHGAPLKRLYIGLEKINTMEMIMLQLILC